MHMCCLQRLGATIFINRDFVKWFQLFDSTFFGKIYGVIMMVGMHAKLFQLCLVLCDPMDCSPPGSLVRGILQARILMRIAMSSSRGSFWPRAWTCVSCISCIGRRVLYCWCYLGSLQIRYLTVTHDILYISNSWHSLHQWFGREHKHSRNSS